jgi:imidazolonepropionase-like amidohydrolase
MFTRALGKKLAIHCYGSACARDAVRAGVDSLEHATNMDDRTIAEMVRRRIYYLPTIDHNQYYIQRKILKLRRKRSRQARTWSSTRMLFTQRLGFEHA